MTAPVSRRTSSPPPPPSKEPTPAEVGKLVTTAQTAEAVNQTAVAALNAATTVHTPASARLSG